MKSIIIILTLISSITNNCLSQSLHNKVTEELDFKINWIHTPHYHADTSNIEGVKVISEYWESSIADESHPNWRYTLSRDEYPSSYIHSDSTINLIEQLINSTQNGLIEEDNFDLISSSECVLNNYFGKEFRWKDLEADEFFKNRVFVIENTIYQLSVYSRSGESHNKAIEQFLISFQLDNNLNGHYKAETDNYIQSYTIEFPETPEHITKVIDSEIGKLTLQMKMFEPKNDSYIELYIANEIAYPPKLINIENTYELNSFFISSINGSVSAVNGELISIHDIEYLDIPGKEFKMYISEGEFIIKYRIFYKNDVLYNIGVMTNTKNDENNLIHSFLNSFKFE